MTASLSFLGETNYRLGYWDDAMVNAELAVSLAETAEEFVALVFARATAAHVYAGRGRFEQAEENVDAIDSMTQVLPSWGARFQVVNARALLAQARGDLDGMYQAILGMLDDSVRSALERMRTWRWRALVVEGLLGAGELDRAAGALADLVLLVETHGLEAARPDAARLEGQLAEARGDVESARHHYGPSGQSVGDADAVPLSEARLRIARGRLLRTQGETRAAIDELRSARHILTRLGALPFLDVCDRELEACGLRASTSGDRDLLALTPREEAVAQLVAEGMSNREVAAQLYVSTKAVEYHLGHIYGKLGIKSRTQLAGRLRADRNSG
jgi:ATP/maltotriose-dependent transcriptional regulator MalT